MNVELCQDSGPWDAYVETNPRATNYHRWRWKQLIESTYGHRTFYLAAQEDGKIRGVLPLVGIKSWLWGRFLVSMPFFSYGGILADTPEAHEQLLRKAESLAGDWGAKHIELRQAETLNGSWQSSTAKVSMSVPLPETSEKLFGSLASRLRNKIRSAQKQGLRAQWGKEELVKDFYKVFSCNMRNLGTPVYPRAWFENFLRVARDTSHILLVWDGEEPVAGTFITTYRDQVELPWIASTPGCSRKILDGFPLLDRAGMGGAERLPACRSGALHTGQWNSSVQNAMVVRGSSTSVELLAEGGRDASPTATG